MSTTSRLIMLCAAVVVVVISTYSSAGEQVQLSLSTDKEVYQPGEQLTLNADIATPTGGLMADGYIALKYPDERLRLINGGEAGADTSQAFARGFGVKEMSGPILSAMLDDLDADGYVIYAVLVKEGSDPLDPNNRISNLAMAEFEISDGAAEDNGIDEAATPIPAAPVFPFSGEEDLIPNMGTANTGWKNASTCRCINEWNNCAGVYQCGEGSSAWLTTPDPPRTSGTQGWGGFHFNIPSNATITGIAVTIRAKVSSRQSPNWMTLLLGWTPDCSTRCSGFYLDVPDEDWKWYTMGPILQWVDCDHIWTPYDFSDENFTVGLCANPHDGRKLDVDCLLVCVYYTTPDITPPPTPTPTPTPTPMLSLVCNPSFEDCPYFTYWQKIGASSKIGCSSEEARDGKYSCKFTDPTSDYSGRGIRSCRMAIVGGRPYDVAGSFQVKGVNGRVGDTHLRFRVEWWDSYGNLIYRYPGGTTGFPLAAFDIWVEKMYPYLVAPKNAAFMTLLIECREVVNNHNDVYVDYFLVTPAVRNLLINEVLYNGVARDVDTEWIEVVNYGSSDCNLSGFYVVECDNDGTVSAFPIVPADQIINPGEYAVFSNEGAGGNYEMRLNDARDWIGIGHLIPGRYGTRIEDFDGWLCGVMWFYDSNPPVPKAPPSFTRIPQYSSDNQGYFRCPDADVRGSFRRGDPTKGRPNNCSSILEVSGQDLDEVFGPDLDY